MHDNSELRPLLERLGKVEGQNRRFKRAASGIVVLVASLLLMGQANPSRTIEAEKFVLKDATGHERGSLFATEQAWGIVLYNRDSSKAVAVAVTDYGNSLLLQDGKGNERIGILASDGGSNVALSDFSTHRAAIELKNGSQGSALTFRDNKGRDRVDVGLSSRSGGVVINDADSRMRTTLMEDTPGVATWDGKGSLLWAARLDSFSKAEQMQIRDLLDKLSRKQSTP